jgi:hypothetical protein
VADVKFGNKWLDILAVSLTLCLLYSDAPVCPPCYVCCELNQLIPAYDASTLVSASLAVSSAQPAAAMAMMEGVLIVLVLLLHCISQIMQLVACYSANAVGNFSHANAGYLRILTCRQ